MMRWFLFETRLGDLVLYLFEALTGLAIVDQEYLAGLLNPLVSPDESKDGWPSTKDGVSDKDELGWEKEDGYLDQEDD